MPRPVIVLTFGFALMPCLALGGTGAHFDPSLVRQDCTPCHRGHGEASTPMLQEEPSTLCLSCHSGASRSSGARPELGLETNRPILDIQKELDKPITHGGTLCIDCHSVHGIQPTPRALVDPLFQGVSKRSTKREFETEAELCLSCHGVKGPRGGDPFDLNQLVDPSNPSYHPVLAGARNPSVSLTNLLGSGSLINCTDCHTNDDPEGPRGPHGSRVQGLLGAQYFQQDFQEESEVTYRLCYACHERKIVLSEESFSLHELHVVQQSSSCSLCHNPHGATKSRALIRFNEPTSLLKVSPSMSGRLSFVSDAPGSGLCYLTCHGKNHDPLGYGLAAPDPFVEGPTDAFAAPIGADSAPDSAPGALGPPIESPLTGPNVPKQPPPRDDPPPSP